MTAYLFYVRQPIRTHRPVLRLAPPHARGALIAGAAPMNMWWWPNPTRYDVLPGWMEYLARYAEQGFHEDP